MLSLAPFFTLGFFVCTGSHNETLDILGFGESRFAGETIAHFDLPLSRASCDALLGAIGSNYFCLSLFTFSLSGLNRLQTQIMNQPG